MKKKNHVREIVRTTDGYLSGKSKNKKPRYGVILYQRNDNYLIVSKIISNRRNARRIKLKANKTNGLKHNSFIDYKLYTGVKNDKGQYKGFRIDNFRQTGYKIGILDLLKARFIIWKDPTRRKIVRSWKRRYK